MKKKNKHSPLWFTQKNPKGDPLSIIVRIEFGDRLLGDSPKQECNPDIPAEFNFSVNLPCTYSDPVCLDDITHKPVVGEWCQLLICLFKSWELIFTSSSQTISGWCSRGKKRPSWHMYILQPCFYLNFVTICFYSKTDKMKSYREIKNVIM